MDAPGIAGIGAALSSIRLETALQAAVLRTQSDVTQELGAQAIRLIQAAVVEPDVGNRLDVRI